MIEYAVYKGDDLLCIGTAIECAQQLKVKPATIQWMATPAGKKRSASRKNPHKCTTAEKLTDD